MFPEYSASPDLHPIMKEFATAVNNAHQSLVKQASKSTDMSSIMDTSLTMIIQARQALDCGSASASSSDLLGNSGHEAILGAIRSCIGSDALCLIKKLGYQVNVSSLGAVCSVLREVEHSILLALGVTTTPARLETPVKPVVPVVNVELDGNSPHFMRKHRSGPPQEDGTTAGEKATQILSVISARLVGRQPNYETPSEVEKKQVRITARVQDWTWKITPVKGQKDREQWITSNPEERRSGILLKGEWQTNGDFTNLGWVVQ